MTDEKRETDLVRCEGCQEMIRPLVEHAVSLVGATLALFAFLTVVGPGRFAITGSLSSLH